MCPDSISTLILLLICHPKLWAVSLQVGKYSDAGLRSMQ